MSDNARELLIYGVAAAKANSRDEARNYLEWVLNTDSDFDQQAEAWYWLSRITDDPKAKRECLENTLAMLPRHPEARRDMAILDGRLDPAAMHDPRFSVAPTTPDTNIASRDAQAYKCPRCGARMTARGMEGALSCGFCGYDPASQNTAAKQQDGSDEQDWIAAIYDVKGHKWEVPTERALSCASCGATVIMPPSNVSVNCPFCSTPYVAQTRAERDLIAPTGVAPFAFDAQSAWARINAWLGQQRFAPSDLQGQSTQSLPRPIYLPFWTFDIDGEVGWRGWDVSTSYGKAVRVQVSGSIPIFYDDLLVPATHSLPDDLLNSLQYDTKSLRPYSHDLLASWPAEVYSLSVADASLVARAYARNSDRTTAAIDVSASIEGKVQDMVIESAELSITSYKLALLPVWVGSYNYAGKTHTVLVNGQNGSIVGDVPRNVVGRLVDGFFNR
ncbi:MAG: hypothetical protein ABIQ44_00210 [Chloroflexia bacterium]